jgi:hypothetical protein
MSEVKKRTAYARLVMAKSKFCKGQSTKTEVKKVASSYVADAVKKATKAAPAGDKQKVAAKAKKEAMQKAGRVLRAGCKVSSAIAGRKKKAATPRKKAVKK